MRRKLMLLLCTVLLPIAAAGIYRELQTRGERVAEVHEETLRSARLVHSDITNIVQSSRNLMEAISTIPAIRDLDVDQCADHLTNLRDKFDRYVSIVLTDWTGGIVCSSGTPMPPNL